MITTSNTAWKLPPSEHARPAPRASRYSDASRALSLAAENLELLLLRHEASLTSDPLPKVKIPHDALVKVFETLIAEGIHARTEAPPWIHVSARKGDDAWVFKVEDHGIGFEHAHSDRVVRLFEKRAAVCREIVEPVGGGVWFDPLAGKGSAFYFSIPA